MTSSPSRPNSESSPGPPKMSSLPGPPCITSAPDPPSMIVPGIRLGGFAFIVTVSSRSKTATRIDLTGRPMLSFWHVATLPVTVHTPAACCRRAGSRHRTRETGLREDVVRPHLGHRDVVLLAVSREVVDADGGLSREGVEHDFGSHAVRVTRIVRCRRGGREREQRDQRHERLERKARRSEVASTSPLIDNPQLLTSPLRPSQGRPSRKIPHHSGSVPLCSNTRPAPTKPDYISDAWSVRHFHRAAWSTTITPAVADNDRVATSSNWRSSRRVSQPKMRGCLQVFFVTSGAPSQPLSQPPEPFICARVGLGSPLG